MAKIFENWDHEKKTDNASYSISNGNFLSHVDGLDGYAAIGKNIDSGINSIEVSFKFKIETLISNDFAPEIIAKTSDVPDSDSYFIFFIYKDGDDIKLSPIEGSKYDVPSLQGWTQPDTDEIIELGTWYYIRAKMDGFTPGLMDGGVQVWLNNKEILNTTGESIKKEQINVFWLGCNNLNDVDPVTITVRYDNFQIYNLSTISAGTQNLADVSIGNYLNTTTPNYLYSNKESKKPIVYDDFSELFNSSIWTGGVNNATAQIIDDYVKCTLNSGASYVTYRNSTDKNYKIYEVTYDMLIEDLDLLEQETLVFSISQSQNWTSATVYDSDTISLTKVSGETQLQIQHIYYGIDADHHTPPNFDSEFHTSPLEKPPIWINVWNKYKIQIWCSDSHKNADLTVGAVPNGKVIIWINDEQYLNVDGIKTSPAVNRFMFDLSKIGDPPDTLVARYRNIVYREIPQEAFGDFFYPSILPSQIVKDNHRSGKGAIYFGSFGKETRHDLANADYYLEAPYPYIGSGLNPLREAEFRKENGSPIPAESYVPKDNAPGISGISAYAWIKPDLGGGTIFEMAGVKEIFAEQAEGGGSPGGPPGGDYHFYPDPEEPTNPEWFKTPKEYFEYYAINIHKTTDRLIIHDRIPGDDDPWQGNWYEPIDFLGVTNVTVIAANKLTGYNENTPIFDGALGDKTYVVKFANAEDATCIVNGVSLRGVDTTFTGDVVSIYGAAPIIEDCQIIGNGNNGSGINAKYTAVTVNECEITQNGNGGIDIEFIVGVANINRTTIKGNSKLTAPGYGAGISAITNGTINITKCDILNNTTIDSGGGVRINGVKANIVNSSIAENISQNGTGGGIHIKNSSLGTAITNCTIVYNSVETTTSTSACGIDIDLSAIVDIQNCIVYYNSPFPDTYQIYSNSDPSAYVEVGFSDIEGGENSNANINSYHDNLAVYPDFKSGTYELKNTSDCQDMGTFSYGGKTIPNDDRWGNPRPYDPNDPNYTPLVDMGYHELQEKPLIVSEVHVYLHNGEKISTHGFDVIDPGGRIVVHDETNGNYPSRENLIIEGSDLAGITLEAAPGLNVILEPDPAGSEPILSIKGGAGTITVNGFAVKNATHGAFSITGSSARIIDCDFSNNTNPLNGGAIYCSGANSIYMEGCTFQSCTATNGGGIYIDNTNGELKDCTVGHASFPCTAAQDGGGIAWINTPSTSAIIHGSVNKSDFQVVVCEAGRHGGGIYLDNAGPTIDTCQISFNTCNGNGGGIYANRYSTGNSIDNCDIQWNHNLGSSPLGYGGGIYLTGNTTDTIISQCEIHNNDCIGNGGGISCYEIWRVTVNSCDLIGNNAYIGGGLYTDGVGDKATILGACIFRDNAVSVSDPFGSGLAIFDAVELDIIDGITVDCSGLTTIPKCIGVYIENNSLSTPPVLYLGNTEIKGCTGTGLQIHACTGIVNNFYIHDCGTLGPTNAVFGGGLKIFNPISPIFIMNTIITNCEAYNGGGVALQLDNKTVGNVNFIFSVIHSNTADGNGASIFAQDAKSKINNCILWANSPVDDIWDPSNNLQTSNNVIGDDPLFVGGTGKAYYHIENPNSPAIDEGSFPDLSSEYPGYPVVTGAAINQAGKDFDGDDRDNIYGAEVHIGVDENDVVGAGRVWKIGPDIDDDFVTVQAGIDDAVANNQVDQGDTLEVQENYTQNETIDLKGQILTIRGLDGYTCTLDANGAGSCVTCNTGETNETVIQNLTIVGGSNTSGGGIYIDGASPKIENCIIGTQADPNEATGLGALDGGGGIYCNNSNSEIINCTVQYNTALQNGGGILAIGEPITITGKYGNYGYIQNNTVTPPTFTGSGGGVAFINSDDSVVAWQYIENNTAKSRGGGVFAGNSNVYITYSYIRFNITQGTHNNIQTEAAGGGGVFMTSCLNATGSTSNFLANIITNNTVSGGDSSQTSLVGGGGVYLHQSKVLLGSYAQGNTISDNIAYGNGGGILVKNDHASGSSQIISNKIGFYLATYGPNKALSNQSNPALRYWGGGGICLIDTDSIVELNIIYKNETNCLLGGGIAGIGSNGDIKKNSILDNRVTDNTSGSGGGYATTLGSPTVVYNEINGNKCKGIGAGAILSGGTKFNGNLVIYNTTEAGDGAGIFIRQAAEVNYNQISSNVTTYGHGGGCVFASGVGGIGMMTGNMIFDNEAGVDGGGIFLFRTTAQAGEINCINNTIIRNKAGFLSGVGGYGGAIGSNLWGVLNNNQMAFANNIFHTNTCFWGTGDEIYIDNAYIGSNIVFDNNLISDINKYYCWNNSIPFDNPIIGDPLLADLSGGVDPKYPAKDFDLTSSSSLCIGGADETYSSGILYDFHYIDQGQEPYDRKQPTTENHDVGADEHPDSVILTTTGNITIKPVEAIRAYGRAGNYLDALTGATVAGGGKISSQTWPELVESLFGRESLHARMTLEGFMSMMLIEETLPEGLDDLYSEVFEQAYFHPTSGYSYFKQTSAGPTRAAARLVRVLVEQLFEDFGNFTWTTGIDGNVRGSAGLLPAYSYDRPFNFTFTPIWLENGGTDLRINSHLERRAIYDKLVLDVIIQPNPSCFDLISAYPEEVNAINTYGELNKISSSNSPYNSHPIKYTMDWDASIQALTQHGTRIFTMPCFIGACMSTYGVTYTYYRNRTEPDVNLNGQDINILLDIPIADKPNYIRTDIADRSSIDETTMWETKYGKDDSYYLPEVKDFNEEFAIPVKCSIGRDPDSLAAGLYSIEEGTLEDWDGRSAFSVDVYIESIGLWDTGFELGEKTDSLASFDVGYTCQTTSGSISVERIFSTGSLPIYVSTQDASVGKVTLYISEIDLKAVHDDLIERLSNINDAGDILLALNYVTIKGLTYRHARVFSKGSPV